MSSRFKEKFRRENPDEERILINENDNDELVESIRSPHLPKKISVTRRMKQNKIFLIPILILCLISSACLTYFVFLRSSNIDNFDPFLNENRKLVIYEKMIESLRSREKTCEGYCRRPETQHVNCKRVIDGDKNYIQTLTGQNRIPMIPNPFLDMSCSAIKQRIHPSSLSLKPLNSKGIAFIRIVFMDYELIEKQLQMSWHPENVFCFSVDSKSTEKFQNDMKKLAECYENIVILPIENSFDSSGHNQNFAQRKCMEELLHVPGWNYLLILQNHDIVVKNVYDLSRVYELLDGANDVNMGAEIDQRRIPGLKWDPKSLKLFKNESEYSEEILKTPMKIASGYTEASLSRAAVEWLIEKVDLTIFIDQFNMTEYAGDEQMIPSFQINSNYEMPGHFTDECFKFKYGHDQITKLTQWASGDLNRCRSKTVRHGACLFGIEDFETISTTPYLMVNKMMPSFDYSIIECTAELIFNQTFLGTNIFPLDEDYYSNLVSVKYHKHHNDPDYELDCKPSRKPWSFDDYFL